MAKEFTVIDQFFCQKIRGRDDVIIGIGDDCAVVTPVDGNQLVISCDTLVENTHFLPDMPAKALGHKSLAVNLSDIAAMGAIPAWITLAITLPEIDEAWLKDFSEALHNIARDYGVALIGGDTTYGPKSITITINGHVPTGKALTRHGAQINDSIYVTGTLGDSALGLELLTQASTSKNAATDYCIERHYYPTPRVKAGQILRDIASSAIDLSDGLIADLTHILNRSTVGAVINVEQLPLSKAMTTLTDNKQALAYALTGGEDYELLFTVAESKQANVVAMLADIGVIATRIGKVTATEQLLLLRDNKPFTPVNLAFEHFSQ